MSITATQKGNVCLLTVDGELIGANVKQFCGLVQRAFAADSRDFVVDFAEATAVDSEGLEALTWLKRECDERLGMVKLCRLSGKLTKTLEVTRLNRQFERYDLKDEALKSFG
ncbi:MAG: STAS domain-containing protein [Planctomycetes bacterium]|nr:STAS domain-containing protein [Planctomycetota bacterium]